MGFGVRDPKNLLFKEKGPVFRPGFFFDQERLGATGPGGAEPNPVN
jgi:hypothetical protein